MNKIASKSHEDDLPQNKALEHPYASDGSDRELEGDVSAGEDHISQRVPESNVRLLKQLNTKGAENEEDNNNGPRNASNKPSRSQNSYSPAARNTNAKPSFPKDKSEPTHPEPKNQNKPKPRPKPEKIDTSNPESIKKVMYSKSPKQAAEEYLQASRHKYLDPPQSASQPRSNNSPTKSAKSYPYGFNSGTSGDPKDATRADSKVEYDSAYTELAKKMYIQKMHQPQSGRSTQVAKTQSYDLILSPYAAQEIENRRNIASKDLQEAIAQRLLKQGEVMNEHSKALVEAYLQREFDDCTFNPKITPYGNYESKRTVDQFLEDQQRFLSVMELKKQKIKEKISAEQKLTEGTYKPELCKKSLKILEKKKKLVPPVEDDVHSRLYKISKNAQQKQMQDIAENEEVNVMDSNASSQFIGQLSRMSNKSFGIGAGEKDATFVPNIHKRSKVIKRDVKIDTILYNDAMRRQHKSIEFAKKLNKNKTTNQKMSEGSRKALASRFIREFDLAITEFMEGDKEQKMDYLQLNEFLKKLCFLKDSESVDLPHFTPERSLLYDLWYTLFADKYGGIHRRNLLVFLLAVLGLNYQITKIQKPDPAESNAEDADAKKSSKHSSGILEKDRSNKDSINGPPEPEGIQPKERRILGSFDEEENYEVTAQDVEKVHRIYNLWFVNRLGSPDNIGQMVSSKKIEENSYHPEINENSRNIAHLYREKILEGTSELIQQNKIQAPKDGKLTHADLLVLSKKVVKEKTEKFKASLEGNELRYCTFRPFTNDYSQTSKMFQKSSRNSQIDEGDEDQSERKRGNAMPTGSMGKDRNFELYSLHKPSTEKRNRDPFDIDYEKNCDECTFQPDLANTKMRKPSTAQTNIAAKNIEKTITRMRLANEAREQKNLWNQRGYYPQNNENSGFNFSSERDKNAKQRLETESLLRKSSRGSRPKSQRSSQKNHWSLRSPGSIGVYNPPMGHHQAYYQQSADDQDKDQEQANGLYDYADEGEEYEDKPEDGDQQYGEEEEEENEEDEEEEEENEEEEEEDMMVRRKIVDEDEDQDQDENDNENESQVDDQNNNEDQEDDNENGEEQEHDSQQENEEDGEQGQSDDGENERVPLLFVDVNLGLGMNERIVVFEGDKSEILAHKFAQEHGLDETMAIKLKELLDSQIAGLLSRIDEELNSLQSETDKNEQQNNMEIYRHDDQIREEDDTEGGSCRTSTRS